MLLILFLVLKGTTHVYLLLISIRHNENQNPWLNIRINCISERSALQLLFIKDKCTFRFTNFQIIRLCKFSQLILNFTFDSTTWSIFIEKFINHRSKVFLISIVLGIFSNIKCFVTQYFIRNYSSRQILKISIRHIMEKKALSSSSW